MVSCWLNTNQACNMDNSMSPSISRQFGFALVVVELLIEDF